MTAIEPLLAGLSADPAAAAVQLRIRLAESTDPQHQRLGELITAAVEASRRGVLGQASDLMVRQADDYGQVARAIDALHPDDGTGRCITCKVPLPCPTTRVTAPVHRRLPRPVPGTPPAGSPGPGDQEVPR